MWSQERSNTILGRTDPISRLSEHLLKAAELARCEFLGLEASVSLLCNVHLLGNHTQREQAPSTHRIRVLGEYLRKAIYRSS